jgi:hypothetical protein
MYQEARPDIPADIRRAVEVDAGHKCSLTTCQEHTYLEIHHINQNREDNRKENLILLCDKHHKMAHAGIIDKKSLRAYKDILTKNSNDTGGYIRATEGDRVYRFLNIATSLLSYNDHGTLSWAGSETGYRFEEEIYIKLRGFFHNKNIYEIELRSYDEKARNTQDRIVDLLSQILSIREQGNYYFTGGMSAKFIPRSPVGTHEYNSEIDSQRFSVHKRLLDIQRLVNELWDYVGNR